MTCSMIVRRLRKDAPYYSVKDYDERLGGDFTMFIVPFIGCEGERFYYARKTEGGELKLEGEGYIVTGDDSLKRHKKEAREDLGQRNVLYYWLDEAGEIVRKEHIR